MKSALFPLFFDGAFPSIISVNFHGDHVGPCIESTTSLHPSVELPDLGKKNVFVLCKKIKSNWVFFILSGNHALKEEKTEEVIWGHRISKSLV